MEEAGLLILDGRNIFLKVVQMAEMAVEEVM
jgi:hypothetical protein